MTSKLHVVADARGRLVRGCLTAGHRHDAPQALPLLEGLAPAYLIADRGYDADPLVAALARSRPEGAGRTVLAVTATGREAEDLAAALRCFIPAQAVAEFPA